MNIRLFRSTRALILAGSIALVVSPAIAQFGMSIVYDPQSYATLGKIWTSDTSLVIKATETLAQAQQLYTQAVLQYNLIKSTTTHFSSKMLWMTTAAQLRLTNVHNTYGETAGWNAALNSNLAGGADTAWNMANMQVNPGTYMSGSIPGASPDLSSLAMVEAFDSSSPDCLNALGQYRSVEQTNGAAETALETDQLDTSDSTNSQIEQLNLLNANGSQQNNETRSQGALQACLAEQTTIANMGQRNAVAAAINDNSISQQQHATNNVMPANESNTWQTYIP